MNQLSFVRFFINHLISYPSPSNISYLWSFGLLSGMILSIQLISGLLLTMHYTDHISEAFNSVEHIMRDVNNGWLIRYIHSNGASFFFIIIYFHIFRGLYYRSYFNPRIGLWLSGVIIFVLLIITAFLGYVLPYGQMSFWGATVITNLVTAIPVIGDTVAQWLWGGFSIGNATLNRFFAIHYLLPIIISVVAICHIGLLHSSGSNNPIGVYSSVDKIQFYPFFYLKDLFSFIVVLIIFSIFVAFFPNLLGHFDNYIVANSLVTPTHIVPEWYLLTFYAILRSIPNKIGGVCAMAGSLLVLAYLVILCKPLLRYNLIRTPRIQYLLKLLFWLSLVNSVILGWIGSCPVEYPYVSIGLQATYLFFFNYTLLITLLSRIEIFLSRE